MIFHLGDFCFNSQEKGQQIFTKLQGKKYLILGNHDKLEDMKMLKWQDVLPVYTFRMTNTWPNIFIFLSHYAHRSWPGSLHGSWHLFGHSHGRLKSWGLSFDVGVDCWDYKPVNLEQVKVYMGQLKNEIESNKNYLKD